MVTTTGDDVLVALPLSPPYMAVIEYVPATNVLNVSVATPAVSVPVPRLVVPLRNVTIPVADGLDTVAFNPRDMPAGKLVEDAVSAVVVGASAAAVTVTVSGAEVLPL